MEQQEIKVGFLNQFSKAWIGGITYFKNLFEAMSTTEAPRLRPYIMRPSDESADCLLPYVELFPDKKYPTNASSENIPPAAFYGMDMLSHLNDYQVSQGGDGIAWIADFQHMHLPEMFDEKETAYRNKAFSTLIKQNRIVCVSSYDALEDFKKFAPEAANKGRCLHFVSIPDPAIYSLSDAEAEEIRRNRKLPERYFYVPNQFWKHKNHIVVLQAIARLKNDGCPIHVVFSGNTFDFRNPDYFDEIKKFCRQEKIEDNVHFLGIISLKEVYFLMRDCLAIVNPSKFEGWSSSVEEAKSIGKTMILSNLNVHYEQAPPNGFYFPCDDPVWLADLLKRAWNELKPGPDLAMEKKAREALPLRVKAFGNDFRRIVLDAIKGSTDPEVLPQDEVQVTVVTVIYNLVRSCRKDQIVRNIESVAAQTDVRVEHLIVDGNSDDGTLEFLEPYVRKYGCRLVSMPDHGIYEAMNRGTILAKGKYVAYLNSDDFYVKNEFLKRSFNALEKGKFDFSYAPVDMRMPNGRPFSHVHTNPDESTCFCEMPFCHQSMLFLRKALYGIGVYNDTFRSAGDYDMILRLILSGKRGVRIDLAGVCFTVDGFSDANMDEAQHETGLIFSRLYTKLGYAMSPEEGRKLYIWKQMPDKLAEMLRPYMIRAFGAGRPDLSADDGEVSPAETEIPEEVSSPLVSVILPLKRFARFMEERIASIRDQQFEDFEVIVLDPGLSSHELKPVEKWAASDSRVRIFSRKDRPVNFGIGQARGKYVYIAPVDDTMKPDCLGRMVSALEEHAECSICDTRPQLIGQQGQTLTGAFEKDIYFGHLSYPAEKMHVRLAPYDCLQVVCGKEVYATTGQLMIRKELFAATGGYPEEAGCAAAYCWSLLAGCYAHVIYLPDALVSWRPDPMSCLTFDKVLQAVENFLAGIPEGQFKTMAASLATLLHFKALLLPLKQQPSRFRRLLGCGKALRAFPKKSLQLAWLMIRFQCERGSGSPASVRSNNALISSRMKKYLWMILDGKVVKYQATPGKGV